jgi:hypothetical protein
LLDLVGIVDMPEEVKALVTGNYTYKDLNIDMAYPIHSISIDVSGNQLQFMPLWNDLSIGFKLQ